MISSAVWCKDKLIKVNFVILPPMLVDGKAIAETLLKKVQERVASLPTAPRLSVLTCAPNFETQKYLSMKKQKAAAVGITMNVVELPGDTSTSEVVQCVTQIASASDGVVVQLPLPPQIVVDQVLAAIPTAKDPDGFNYPKDGACLSPVVGAIDEISSLHQLVWKGKQVVVLGEGKLVGVPAAAYAERKGAQVTVLHKDNFNEAVLQTADIVISGMGAPQSIKPAMLKSGVVVFDAGTSEDGGILVGDVDPAVGDIASLLTPVPGGIGPITIAYLLHNVTTLTSR